MSLANEVDYSVIICTYNPDERLLKRCLNAVHSFHIEGFNVEVIVVDNNSGIPLNNVTYIQDFLRVMPHSKLIEAKEQGLNHARMAGIKEAKGSFIIFFDDDNEPESDYLMVLWGLHKRYPDVAAWGPGNVEVDFIEGVHPKLESYARDAFQERHEVQITYSNQRDWQACYPFGTGLCLDKKYFISYLSLVEQGYFTLSDRKGNQLSSGGDTQMVLYCISKGAAAGVAPGLRLTHIVPEKRTTFEYLKRLTYGTSICYSTCVLEVFPDHMAYLKKHAVPKKRFITKTLKKYFLLSLSGKPKKSFDLISYIGAVSGDYKVLNIPVPQIIVWVLKRLKAV